ncbi:dephospho-CoA kinase [Ulvibacterium sp.]|uniref:dephospho-CoA kinase n=1 Tax=Ulvibacterium sp. TaxID=2665914 RepID=UPI002625C888|nr:dephospho-CoA kinase [Ulvibacterium sp.]
MKIVGLTGGMGSGKSTIAHMFKEMGVPVYNSDERAKKLMVSSKTARKKIIELLGTRAYSGKKLNRSYIAEMVFKDKGMLKKLNGIVHPLVRKSFKSWAGRQTYPYVIQEAAIIFENKNQDFYDKIILVTAPKEVRLNRILKRDGSQREKILERMGNQWPDSKKIPLADFVVNNKDLAKTRLKVEGIHSSLLDNC